MLGCSAGWICHTSSNLLLGRIPTPVYKSQTSQLCGQGHSRTGGWNVPPSQPELWCREGCWIRGKAVHSCSNCTDRKQDGSMTVLMPLRGWAWEAEKIDFMYCSVTDCLLFCVMVFKQGEGSLETQVMMGATLDKTVEPCAKKAWM